MHTAPNGKKYIGRTKAKPERRWGKNGINYKKAYFYNAILEFGW